MVERPGSRIVLLHFQGQLAATHYPRLLFDRLQELPAHTFSAVILCHVGFPARSASACGGSTSARITPSSSHNSASRRPSASVILLPPRHRSPFSLGPQQQDAAMIIAFLLGQLLHLAVAPAAPVIHPKQDGTSQVGVGTGHFRKVAIVTNRDATLVTFDLEGHQAVAGPVEGRLVVRAFRFPPEMGFPVVGEYAFRSNNRRQNIIFIGRRVPGTLGDRSQTALFAQLSSRASSSFRRAPGGSGVRRRRAIRRAGRRWRPSTPVD